MSETQTIKELSNKEKIGNLKERLKHKARENVAFAGYLLYIWNPEKLHSKLYPLPEVKSTVRISSTGESFNLGKPSLYLEGKPLFIVIRELPYSIELELKDNNYHFKVLEEKGYTASEIDAKINSMYVNQIFRAKRLTKTDIIVFLLSILSSILITSMMFMVGKKA